MRRRHRGTRGRQRKRAAAAVLMRRRHVGKGRVLQMPRVPEVPSLRRKSPRRVLCAVRRSHVRNSKRTLTLASMHLALPMKSTKIRRLAPHHRRRRQHRFARHNRVGRRIDHHPDRSKQCLVDIRRRVKLRLPELLTRIIAHHLFNALHKDAHRLDKLLQIVDGLINNPHLRRRTKSLLIERTTPSNMRLPVELHMYRNAALHHHTIAYRQYAPLRPLRILL